MSNPSTGVIMADAWMAKYEVSFKREEKDTPSQSKIELENTTIKTLEDKSQVFEELSNMLEKTIIEDLEKHAESLKTQAINKIIQETPLSTFEVSVTPYTLEKAWDDEELVKEQIKILVYGAFFEDGSFRVRPNEECVNAVKKWWKKEKNLKFEILPINTKENLTLIYNAMENKEIDEVLKTEVEKRLKDHVVEENKKRREQAASNKEKLKKEFEKQLKAEGNISYTQSLVSEIKTTLIVEDLDQNRKTLTYNQSQTVLRSKEGEKFSEIFNDKKFYESKQAIMQRTEWFWEYIRENEDTQNLENLLRYLLNIATGTEKFGKFDADDIEELFNSFKPKGMTGMTQIYGNNVEIKVWTALTNAGYSKEAVAGVMGNIEAESGFDSSIIEAGNGIGFGLCQWSFGRRTQLEKYAESKGVEPSDIDTQIEFLLTEITPGAVGPAQGYANYQLMNNKGYTKEKWIEATTPEVAAVAFCWIFERPGKPALEKRERYARDYYEKYKDFATGGYYEENTSSKKIVGHFTSSLTGRTFTIYYQCEIPGWRRCCNRAAQISVCSGYWPNTNYMELIDEADDAPNLSMPRYDVMYDKCNLTYTNKQLTSKNTFDSNLIKQQIQSGGYVILYLRGTDAGHDGTSYISGRDWAGTMHWVSILGYRELNGTGEIFVGDSGHSHTGWVALNEFDGIASSVVFVDEK